MKDAGSAEESLGYHPNSAKSLVISEQVDV